MGERRFLAFIVVALVYNFRLDSVSSKSHDSKILTNCILDDLRNINDEFKIKLSDFSVANFVFSHCDLSIIPENCLADVMSLRSIDFQHSNISSIHPSALNGLSKLEVLRIVGNPNLTQFQSWTTNDLDKLYELDLHNNNMNDLDPLALRHYPKLLSLNLQKNSIHQIPASFFYFTPNIETLNLACNSLQRIESFTFKELLPLVDLNLAYNQITFIDSYAFSTTTRLKSLQLNGNQIIGINSIVFYNLVRLEYLNLSENALSGYAVEEKAFVQNKNLLHLDVSRNSMRSIQATALKGLNSLQVRHI